MDSSSWRAEGPSDLRNEVGMLSGPAAPLSFVFLIADSNSRIRSEGQLLSSAAVALRHFLDFRLRSQSAWDMVSLLTLVF